MYEIRDTVEVGHSNLECGSITIVLGYNEVLSEDSKKIALEKIDYLDHCLITDNTEMARLSDRYFLLGKCEGILKDTVSIMSNFLDFDSITVEVGKESYTTTQTPNNIIKYNVKG
jgi:hypothetical protein